MDTERSRVAAAMAALRRRLRSVVHWWNGSLQVKVVSSTLVVGIITILVLGMYLTTAIRSGLNDRRIDQALADAAAVTTSAQERFDSALSTTGTEAQALVRDLMRQVQNYRSGPRDFVLLRSPAETSTIALDPIESDASKKLQSLITSDMRSTLTPDSGQLWQSVAIPSGKGVEPGIVVGHTVQIPVVGQYQLYFVYSLEPEQATVNFVRNVLIAGSAVLLVLVGVLAWVTTRQVVRPVQEAASIAERIAAGHLDDRMAVHGEDEIARWATSFNKMAVSLQDKISQMEHLTRSQRRFVSDVSHELRTPLTTIKMASEVLLAARSDFEPVQARSAELLAAQIDRFEDLLRDLLEISRFDAGAALLDATDVDVRVVIDKVVDNVRPLADRKGIDLRTRVPARPVNADVDARRVERVVRNLVANAIEHADGQPIDIALAANGTALAIVVRDHGIGLTPDQATHVFDRFWRADPARARSTGGTGLGLAIALEDARLHGGRLEAWGQPGEGASFRLTLPLRAGMPIGDSPLPLLEEVADVPVVPDIAGPAALPVLEGMTSVPVPAMHGTDPDEGHGDDAGISEQVRAGRST